MSRATDLIKELRGDTCACSSPKSAGHSFCGACYRSLPKSQQRDLYHLIGDGYEEAHAAAMATLRGNGRVAKGEG